MQLVNPLDKHFTELMSWFTTEEALAEWSGPGFRYPFTTSSFIEDLRVSELKSFALMSEDKQMLAFGQYYNRIDRCHLGRLVVSPKHRGQGVAAELLKQLCEAGKQNLALSECSLFVVADNDKAIKAYQKFGFVFADYPTEIPMDNCLYMVKS